MTGQGWDGGEKGDRWEKFGIHGETMVGYGTRTN